MNAAPASSGPITLRDYQTEALDAIENEWDKGRSPTALVLPTGAGKTTIFSALTARWFRNDRPGKTLVLVHRDELARQAAARIKADAPHLRVGVVKAERDEVWCDVVVGSVQTLARASRRERLRNVGMIIIDECHHAASTSYQTILKHYGAYRETNPTPCVGVTATLERADAVGFGRIFADVCYTKDIMWMIRQGYLADARGLSVVSEGIDLGKVRKSRGDYNEAQLGHVMGQDIVCHAVAGAYLDHACDENGTPRSGVLFAPTVESAENMAAAFNAAGIACEVITGTTPVAERAAIFHRHRTGVTSVLANCMVLTEGWDAPWCKVAVIARPTMSAALYVQMAGRVLRRWRGETALILDVVGAARVHKLASMIDMSEHTPKEDETFLEAEERELGEEWEQGRERREAKGPRYEAGGELGEVDLFASSTSAWMRTDGGVWFLPVRDVVLFLWPGVADDGQETFSLARVACSPWSRGVPRKAGDGYCDLPLELVMGRAETYAFKLDSSTFSSRNASWRKKRSDPATDRQRGVANQLGIPHTPATTKVELSDLISVAAASRAIDGRLD